MSASSLKILVIMPAYNEEGNVGRTVLQVCAAGFDVLVIDDGSKDATAREARNNGARVVSLPFNLGIGGAVQTGFQYAHRFGYDIAVQIDGDGQHDVAFLPKLLEPITTGRADMVIGSRFLEDGGGFKSTFSRRIGIGFFVRLISLLTEVQVTDPTSGFRAHNRKLIEAFARYYPHDFPEPEAIVVASRKRARILEVPVVMRERQAGNSSIRYFKSLYYMAKVTLAICLHMMHRRRNL